MSLQGACPPFRASISWIISPFKFWTATIFLHAHLQVVYYKCVKSHKNPISRLGGVVLTRYMDGRTIHRLQMSPFNKTTSTKDHLSYQAIFQMHWDSKILLNCLPTSKWGQPSYKAIFSCQKWWSYKREITVFQFYRELYLNQKSNDDVITPVITPFNDFDTSFIAFLL